MNEYAEVDYSSSPPVPQSPARLVPQTTSSVIPLREQPGRPGVCPGGAEDQVEEHALAGFDDRLPWNCWSARPVS
jgi:hypothetical protein